MSSINQHVFSLDDHLFMQRAIKLAKKAEAIDEIPVGAVVVHQGKIIGEGEQVCDEVEEYKMIRNSLNFVKPFKSKNKTI